MKRRKANRLFLYLIIFVFICFVIIILINKRSSYSTIYNVNNISVLEEYNKTNSIYKFTFKYNDINYTTMIYNKYIKGKNLIGDINLVQSDDLMCLYVTDSKVNIYPFCYNKTNQLYYSPFYKDIDFVEKNSYQNIKINDYDYQKYLLWNYNGFLYFDGKDIKNISLFKKELYNLSLYYQTKDYLILPDYDSEFYFKKVYVINIKNGKVSTIDLKFDISFDSYFLGDYQNKVYLYDKKNEIEYFIDLGKKELFKTNYKTLENNRFKSISNQKLKTTKVQFKNDVLYDYKVDNDILYMNDLVVATGDIKIVNVIGKKVFYILDDVLYSFDIYDGKMALFKYSEWKFNNQNMVFVF